MDERTFRAPEPEDNDLPEAPAAAEEREDNALPGPDYIGNASALFNFSGSGAPDDDPDGPSARQVPPPSYAQRGTGEIPTRQVTPASLRAGADPGSRSVPPAAPQEAPLPPFLQQEEPFEPRPVPVTPLPTPIPAPTPAPAPDPDLMPEETETADGGRGTRKKAWWILLACGLAMIAVAAGMILVFLIKGNPFAGSSGAIKVPASMPQTEQEIVDFYRIAVNAVKKDGLAGYRKKTTRSISTPELTGVRLVDDLLGSFFREYVTPEDQSASETYEKGSEEAKAQFPGFTLKDLSYIRSADCVRVGDTYQITIVFQHEDTPTAKNSFLGQATDAVLFWDTQIEPALAQISQLHAYEDVHVDYVDMTIYAEIGADGRFHAMTHTAPANVTVGSARLGIFTFTDKSLQLESTASYTDFRY